MSYTDKPETLPGLDEAIAQLRPETSTGPEVDDLYADPFDDPLPEVPDSGQVSVDSALHALTILQLGAAPGMIPPPGVLRVIEAPDARARKRIGTIVQAMIDDGAVCSARRLRKAPRSGQRAAWSSAPCPRS